MFTKNKTFLSKSKYFLLASSSIGLLASTEALAVDIAPVERHAYIRQQNDWLHNRAHRTPQNKDNIILTENNQNINFDQNINIGDINLYGFTSNGFVIHDSNPTRNVSINNIVNFNDQRARTAVQNALGVPLAYGGNKDAKVQIRLQYGGISDSSLTITGNDISAVDSIVLGGATSKLIFNNAITVNTKIYSSGVGRGYVSITNDGVVFESPVGTDGKNHYSIYAMTIDGNKSVTLKSNIYATDIIFATKSTLIIDSSKQNIGVHSGVATNDQGAMKDGDGIIQIRNTKNTITFHNDIGSRDTRVGEITITSGKGTIFNKVYAKSIKVANNHNVEFKEKLDMQQYNLDGKGRRLVLLGAKDTGNLEFTKHGKVKFHKDFAGDITAKMPKLGIVTFVNTSDIYGIGSKNKKIEELTFEGNHIHNLHKNIHAERINFDSGTYNIATEDVTIDGNANINGSILNLAHHNLIFQGKVEFSNNINLFVTGGNKLIFENHAPTVDNTGANIIITIDGAQPADERAALATFKVDVGVFPPVGSHYDVARGILVLPSLRGAIPAAPVRAPVPVVAAPAPVPGGAAPPPPIGGVPAGGAAPVAPVPGGAVAVGVPPAVVGVPAGGGAAAPAPAGAAAGGAAAPAPAGAPPPVGGVLAGGAAPVAPVPGGAVAVGVPLAVVGVPAGGGAAAPAPAGAAAGGAAAPVAPVGVAAPAPVGAPPAGVGVPAGGGAAPVVPAPGGAAAPAAPPPPVVGVPAGGGGAAPVAPAPGGVAAPAAAGVPPAVVGVPAGGGAAPVVPAPGGAAAPAAPPPPVVGVPAGGGAAAPVAPAPGGVAAPAPAGAPLAVVVVPAGGGAAAPTPTPVVAVAPTPAVPVVSPVIELANAISNIVVSAKQGATANKATQEVINKRAVSVMQNPEKHATELAKELASSGTDFKEAARVANDDVYVTGKTKQEQSLLFAATLTQIAPDKQDEAVKHLTDQATRSVSVANVTTEAVGANITNHLSGSNTAIAAGDEDDNSILSSKKGIWVAGTFGSSNQGIYKGGASYKGKVAGATIGGDLYIGDNGVVGIAYSNMSSNFKFTGANPGDKLSANSNVISIYGQQQFNNGFMLQGIFSGSNSKITKKNSRRVGASIYKLATGKYTSKAYAFETTVGYQVSTINDISLMPNIGIRYNSYKDEAYTETGTGVNNTYVAPKSGNMVTGIAGMKITMSKKLSEDTQIIPGLHASIENSFNNKQQKVKARFIWADNYFENAATASTPKVGYNLGASLLTKHKNIELLATYNCNLRSKYHSHQGSLKLKLLF